MTTEIPFPGSAVDGAVFFHEDKVCVYHKAEHTWECRSIVSETPQPPTQDVYMTVGSVFNTGDKRAEWQQKLKAKGVNLDVPTLRTQEEVNEALFGLLLQYIENHEKQSK